MLSVESKQPYISPEKMKEQGAEELASPTKKELSALKIISKDKLHMDDVKIIRGEARVLEVLEGRPNIVQLKNVSTTQ